MFDLVQRIGMYESGMNGPSVISWTEINAWCSLNEISLTPTEQNIIKRLSGEFCSQYHESSDPIKFPPAAITLDGEDYDRQYMADLRKFKR